MLAWANGIIESSILRWNGAHDFSPKISFSMDFGTYILKTVNSDEELMSCLKLRHQVFHQEARNEKKVGMQIDKYDGHSDHIIIIHKLSNKVIGNYRIASKGNTHLTYSAQQFDLTQIYNLDGPHLELGRACIRKDFRRSSTVISLLWRGVIEYMNICGAKVLYGCTSLKINTPREAALIYKFLLDQGYVMSRNIAAPRKNAKVSDFDLWFSIFQKGLIERQVKEAQALIPPFLNAHLNLGARIASVPSLNKSLDCIKILTVLKKEDLNKSAARRFRLA
jgi:putative hemolysin